MYKSPSMSEKIRLTGEAFRHWQIFMCTSDVHFGMATHR